MDLGYRFSCFLVNSSDRIIRVYESEEVLACGKDGEPEPIQKLQDLVNRLVAWLREAREKEKSNFVDCNEVGECP